MIRKMNYVAGEVDIVMDIWLESTIEAHSFIAEEYWRKNYDLVKDVYIPQSDTYVYSEGDSILGFISILNEEFIGALFVDKKFQGNGVGKKLIEHVKPLYKNLSLAVYKENKKAVDFYKHIGFDYVCEQNNEETDEPEYIMSISK